MPRARVSRSERTTPAAAHTPRPLRVLIVDDHRDAAEILRVLVEDWGYEARIAGDGLQALAVADEFRPDVMLLDIVLPKMHGYDVARAYRSRPHGKGTVFVAVTAWGQEADRQMSKAAGIQHHFVKPADPRRLAALLRGLSPVL